MDGKCANDSNQRNKNKFKIENPISTAINVHHDIKPIKRTMDKLSPKYPLLNRMLTSKQKKEREREVEKEGTKKMYAHKHFDRMSNK